MTAVRNARRSQRWRAFALPTTTTVLLGLALFACTTGDKSPEIAQRADVNEVAERMLLELIDLDSNWCCPRKYLDPELGTHYMNVCGSVAFASARFTGQFSDPLGEADLTETIELFDHGRGADCFDRFERAYLAGGEFDDATEPVDITGLGDEMYVYAGDSQFLATIRDGDVLVHVGYNRGHGPADEEEVREIIERAFEKYLRVKSEL